MTKAGGAGGGVAAEVFVECAGVGGAAIGGATGGGEGMTGSCCGGEIFTGGGGEGIVGDFGGCGVSGRCGAGG